MKKWHFYIRNVHKSPPDPYLGAFMGFMGPKPHFYGSHKLSITLYRACLKLNRSIEKMALLHKKNYVKVPKTHFWVFLSFMGPKSHFYGSQKPQIEIYYILLALYETDPMKKWHSYIRNDCNVPKNHFWGAFMGFMGPKWHFYGSQKPQIEFYHIGPALY